ncbi:MULTISPECIES: hypothetical protein [Enterobacterales]|uniref:hypothetical protein n=1 Tax=Enterobacterales TaxID=91347 RepID=UPI00217E2CBC|nr:hypothetical protein [Proteus mirabilis]EJF7775849.1 hypothetical protein [Salmonella enterica subsp. enterica]MCH7458407.1 hypothetical protein [Escherichia coli]MCS6719222.1 hypothetical protein [Proteus mirabilis]MCS6729797.1 hypothetical protein [Proteus mirabilis]MCS6748415.1 hypothetical protein [Proteus mirabilis]
MKTIRKNKGDVTYYLSRENNDSYRLIKKIKARATHLVKDGHKTTKITLSDLLLTHDQLYNLDYSLNGLRADDKITIELLIGEFFKNGK